MEAQLAAAQDRLASLHRAMWGDASDRIITVDAVWEERGARTFGASVMVYRDRAIFFPMNCAGPEYLYAAALHRGMAKVRYQTGGTEGLVIRVPKAMSVEATRLLREPGAWAERFGLSGDVESLVWWFLPSDVRRGLTKFRMGALPKGIADQLAWVASRAKHLPKREAGRLGQSELDRTFNAAMATNPPTWASADAS